ncbi:MAG: hypothetical protein RLO50_21560 [Azospirillaceae bacterium]
MTAGWEIVLAPLLPWPLWGLLAALAAIALGLRLWRARRGVVWRGLFAAVALAALLDPSFVREEREPLNDVVVLLVDRSASTAITGRGALIDETVAAMEAEIADIDGLDLRVVEMPRAGQGGLDGETLMIEALRQATADLPRARLAGALLVTDGQVHDSGLWSADDAIGPVHALLAGSAEEVDRRLVLDAAPAFGLVGEAVEVTLGVVDEGGAEGTPVAVEVLVDGTLLTGLTARTGEPFTVSVPVEHAGEVVVEARAETLAGEITTANNALALSVNGVRDRLRVLLVSGAPHAGERTWRNTLKSDPAVDLVHFTILRPPDRQDGTPLDELSLIAFPVQELFAIRLHEFDLVIFDRYQRRGVLPSIYFQNIADYVEWGGAMLDVSGPPFADVFSTYRTALGTIYPAEPTGEVLEAAYRPQLTEIGQRHPVTAGLDGSGDAETGPQWGPWLRQIDVTPHSGETLMSGIGERPLLMLDRVGEGRMALLASDHIWLWSRGYQGGGPQGELVRRLAHWLMGEPSLAEERLDASSEGGALTIERRSLGPLPSQATVTAPDGSAATVALEEVSPGLARGSLLVDTPGLYRVTDGALERATVIGDPAAPELSALRASAGPLAGIVEQSGGSQRFVGDDGVPTVRHVSAGRTMAGNGWIGLQSNRDYRVTGVASAPILPGWLLAVVLTALALAAWIREGR